MSHFAKIDKNGIVTKKIVAEQDFINSGRIGDSFEWIQVSYNNNFRKKFPRIGDKYDKINDVFISSQPYPSWILDENFDWKAPISHPIEDIEEQYKYCWDEENQQWVLAEDTGLDSKFIK